MAAIPTVFIYNLLEDEWRFLSACRPGRRLDRAMDIMDGTGDCYFLAAAAAADDFIYVSPRPVSAAFRRYARSLLPFRRGEIICPKPVTRQLCRDLINDSAAFRRLVRRLKPGRRVKLLAYSASPQFYRLAEALADQKIRVLIPESPRPSAAWTVNCFGSKSGVRRILGRLMPPGKICSGRRAAAARAARLYCQNRGVVIKTDPGTGGSGVLIFREGDLPADPGDCRKQLETILSRQPYWDRFPVVTEKLIRTNPGAGYPNVEYCLSQNGTVNLCFYGLMSVNKQGEYCGMAAGKDTLPPAVRAKILAIGRRVARRYWLAGYRGRFDIDLVRSVRGRLYVTETNLRNTGWSDIDRIVTRLLGPGWYRHVHVFNRDDCRLGRKITLPRLLTRLAPVRYSPRSRTGIIINSANSLNRGYLYYTVIAPDKKQALAIYKKMLSLIR